LVEDSGVVYVESMTEKPMWTKQGNTQETKFIAPREEPMYLIIGEFSRDYVLQLNDIIKFGRTPLQVIQLNAEKKEFEDPAHH